MTNRMNDRNDPIAYKNALSFIIDSILDIDDMTIDRLQHIDSESLREFAIDNEFTPRAYRAALTDYFKSIRRLDL